MYAGGGRLTDLLGTRRGFAIIMLFWSFACLSHGLGLIFGMLAVNRFLLGTGKGAAFRLPLEGSPTCMAAQLAENVAACAAGS